MGGWPVRACWALAVAAAVLCTPPVAATKENPLASKNSTRNSTYSTCNTGTSRLLLANLQKLPDQCRPSHDAVGTTVLNCFQTSKVTVKDCKVTIHPKVQDTKRAEVCKLVHARGRLQGPANATVVGILNQAKFSQYISDHPEELVGTDAIKLKQQFVSSLALLFGRAVVHSSKTNCLPTAAVSRDRHHRAQHRNRTHKAAVVAAAAAEAGGATPAAATPAARTPPVGAVAPTPAASKSAPAASAAAAPAASNSAPPVPAESAPAPAKPALAAAEKQPPKPPAAPKLSTPAPAPTKADATKPEAAAAAAAAADKPATTPAAATKPAAAAAAADKPAPAPAAAAKPAVAAAAAAPEPVSAPAKPAAGSTAQAAAPAPAAASEASPSGHRRLLQTAWRQLLAADSAEAGTGAAGTAEAATEGSSEAADSTYDEEAAALSAASSSSGSGSKNAAAKLKPTAKAGCEEQAEEELNQVAAAVAAAAAGKAIGDRVALFYRQGSSIVLQAQDACQYQFLVTKGSRIMQPEGHKPAGPGHRGRTGSWPDVSWVVFTAVSCMMGAFICFVVAKLVARRRDQAYAAVQTNETPAVPPGALAVGATGEPASSSAAPAAVNGALNGRQSDNSQQQQRPSSRPGSRPGSASGKAATAAQHDAADTEQSESDTRHLLRGHVRSSSAGGGLVKIKKSGA